MYSLSSGTRLAVELIESDSASGDTINSIIMSALHPLDTLRPQLPKVRAIHLMNQYASWIETYNGVSGSWIGFYSRGGARVKPLFAYLSHGSDIYMNSPH